MTLSEEAVELNFNSALHRSRSFFLTREAGTEATNTVAPRKANLMVEEVEPTRITMILPQIADDEKRRMLPKLLVTAFFGGQIGRYIIKIYMNNCVH
jgi:hypothetical protein